MRLPRLAALAACCVTTSLAAQSTILTAGDPRIGLKTGWKDAGEAARNVKLVAHRDRPDGFLNPATPFGDGYDNTDMAFRGNDLFVGSYAGWQVWDISKPSAPVLKGKVICPGGQGDVSIYRNLLFSSVQETRSRLDCGTQGVADSVSAERFRGIRIYDVSDLANPRVVGAVQTCRGSHTHTLVVDPHDAANVYIYVQGTSVIRSSSELAGCLDVMPDKDTSTSKFRIDVIRVPVATPGAARIVNSPRIFADSTGNIAGLWKGGSHGEGTQTSDQTDRCHDITLFTELSIAAGACAGNGILLDIHDPVHPKRIAEVMDPNFEYWHSATFNNDASKVLFTDEWGGGSAARCRATDRPEWGADAIFTRDGNALRFAGYYKLPVAQTDAENCVAHNGSLIPVPGRDLFVQAWYQGGLSIMDFTDPAHPKEIAFFDRGPTTNELVTGGYWSTYWYNGHIYGTEILRGLDVFELLPSDQLSQNEIDAAKLVHLDVFNPQAQPKFVWPASFVVARAYLDQLVRNDGLRRLWASPVYAELSRAEKLSVQARRTALTALASRLDKDVASSSDSARVRALAGVVRDLAK